MKVRPATSPMLWSLPVVATALLLSSCAQPVARPTQVPASTPTPALLAQVGYGAQADFVQCIPPQCPVRTPKTLGAAPMVEPPLAPPLATPSGASPSAAPLPAVEPDFESHDRAEVEQVVTEQLTWSVPFAFGNAQLGAAAQAVMRQVVEELPNDSRITIAGRTDSSGPAAINDALARARAEAVRDHLVRARPELAPAITVEAQGNCCFTASNETAAGRARNRRVDIAAEFPAPPP